jgi:hypothetical protein
MREEPLDARKPGLIGSWRSWNLDYFWQRLESGNLREKTLQTTVEDLKWNKRKG